jgi:hypothetical protein
MLGRIPWTEVAKFLSGAFFVSAGVLFYLYMMDVSVPVAGFIVPPPVHAVRSMVHSVFFIATFWFGFIRKRR